MLLAQSFDPWNETQRKQSNFASCRIISRARQALSEFKNKMHENITNRHIQALLARNYRFIMVNNTLPLPQQQPWFGGCCYDPYFNSTSPFMMLPPPPPPLYPLPYSHPYCMCAQIPSLPQPNNAMYYSPSSTILDSTPYSPNSTMYNSSNEKALLEEYEHPVHPLQEIDSYYTSNLARRNSDIIHDKRPSHHNRRRNTSNTNSVYYQ